MYGAAGVLLAAALRCSAAAQLVGVLGAAAGATTLAGTARDAPPICCRAPPLLTQGVAQQEGQAASLLYLQRGRTGVLQAVMGLAQGLGSSREALLWCKERAARAGDRAAALVPALQELERAVLAPGQGVEVQLVESVSIMLVLLAKVRPLLV
jgi:hypothetical protein